MNKEKHNNNDKRYDIQVYRDYQKKNGKTGKRWQTIVNADWYGIINNFWDLYITCTRMREHVRIYDRVTHNHYKDKDKRLQNLESHNKLVWSYLDDYAEYIDIEVNRLVISDGKDHAYVLELNSFLEKKYYDLVSEIKEALESITGAECSEIFSRCGLKGAGKNVF